MPEHYFRHIDGGLYRFISRARSADDEGDMVVYEHLWPFEPGMWVRKRSEFEARFAPVDEMTVKRAMKQDRDAAQSAVRAAKTARRSQSIKD